MINVIMIAMLFSVSPGQPALLEKKKKKKHLETPAVLKPHSKPEMLGDLHSKGDEQELRSQLQTQHCTIRDSK